MPVNLEKLQLATLGVVEPKLEAMFQKHVMNIVNDCLNRPGEKDKRSLTLKFDIIPVIEIDKESGQLTCDEVRIQFKGESKVPTYRTKAFPMKLSRGGLMFNREIPEQLNQPSLVNDQTKNQGE